MFDQQGEKESKSRVFLLQGLVLVLFCVIGLRLWYFQVYKGEIYADKARDNIARQQSIHAPRGLIRDRDGSILAENQPAYGLAIIREDCPDLEAALRQVSQWTGEDYAKLRKNFEQDKQQVKPFARQILVPKLDFEELALIESQLMDWPGLRIVPKPLRTYPQGKLMSHVLGYVAQANKKELEENSELRLGDNVGKHGLEKTFDKRLRGSKGLKQQQVNAQGRTLEETVLQEPEPGQDLELSIDLELQKFAWNQLQDHSGALIVMDPSQGKILAMVSKPGFDNNRFVHGISNKAWKEFLSEARHPLLNRCLQSTYPPASVFKLVLAAAALEHGEINPKDTVYCPGHYRVGRRVFRCWKKGGHGKMDLKDALKQSCDVYFYKLGEELGVEKISKFAKEYGFNSRTGIDIPNENKGLIPDKEWKLRRFGSRWQGGDTINLSIGQGYTQVTPLQIARYTAALVNGGKLYKPQLLLDEEPQVQAELPLQQRELEALRQAMLATVEEPQGTAWRLRTPGVQIGGKTGTAQVIRLLEEHEDMDQEEIPYNFRHHAWMASFGQKAQQNYVVVALVEHGGMGGSTAGPIVKAIYDYLFVQEKEENGSIN
ncbi:MAG: penicillin-binding protein 2 [Desulfohalobiaceae bacterium]